MSQKKPKRAGDHKRPVPPVAHRDPRHDKRRHDRPDVGAGVEDPGRQRALPPREPLGDALDGRGKVAPFAEPQRKTRRHEAGHRRRRDKPHGRKQAGSHGTKRGGFRACHRRQAPDDERDGVAGLGPDLVHQAAGQHQANRVRALEREDDVAVVDLVPAELALERGLEDPDDPSVDVVDRGCEEEQRADDPAVVPGLGRWRHRGGVLVLGFSDAQVPRFIRFSNLAVDLQPSSTDSLRLPGSRHRRPAPRR